MSLSPSDGTTAMEIRDDLFGIITGQLKLTFLDAFNNYPPYHEPTLFYMTSSVVLMKLLTSFKVPMTIPLVTT